MLLEEYLMDKRSQCYEVELQTFTEVLENSIPVKPKDSAELLALRKTEEQLPKKEKILQTERDEYEKWNVQRQAKIRNLISQLKQKQLNEINALQQRIISGQDDRERSDHRNWRSYSKILKCQKRFRELIDLRDYQQYQINLPKMQSIMQQSRMNQSKMQQSFMRGNNEENIRQ
ncbi:hypothetical protein pb186bvf_012638 [Paramecium bursaria]